METVYGMTHASVLEALFSVFITVNHMDKNDYFSHFSRNPFLSIYEKTSVIISADV